MTLILCFSVHGEVSTLTLWVGWNKKLERLFYWYKQSMQVKYCHWVVNCYSKDIFCLGKFDRCFMTRLRLLSQKALHRDSDPVGAMAMLANFLKPLYFRRLKTWMLHTLYIDASCYEVSVSHMSNVLYLIFMVQQLLEKKLRFF